MKADSIYASYTNNISKNIVLYYDATNSSSNIAAHEANVYIHKNTRTVQEIKESYYKPYEYTPSNTYKFSFVVYMILAFMIVLYILFV
jgi:galactokinase/mevalonate kinase-like predicted kinase